MNMRSGGFKPHQSGKLELSPRTPIVDEPLIPPSGRGVDQPHRKAYSQALHVLQYFQHTKRTRPNGYHGNSTHNTKLDGFGHIRFNTIRITKQ